MGGSFVVGGSLLSTAELDERLSLGQLEELRPSKSSGIVLMDGTPHFAPIGIGKPLSIEIVTVYTGDAPRRFLGFLSGNPSLLVVSGAKGVQVTSAALRAVNQLVKASGERQYLDPDAFSDGSPVVYYTPAVTDATILTSYELVVDSFDDRLFQSIAALFASAGGLPIFAPASAYLLAGSMVMKIFAQLGKALLETDPFLRSTFPIRFDTPLMAITESKQIVLCNDAQESEFKDYLAQPLKRPSGKEQLTLVHKSTGKEYQGPAPYIVAQLNGKPRRDLESFVPKQASAQLLEDFYRAASGPKTVEVLESAMELYNDFSFREKADHLAAEVDKLPEDAEERVEVEALVKAYEANIRNELFKRAKD